MIKTENLFGNIPETIPEEIIDRIGGNENVRIERIVSYGHASPSDFWYNQDENEFVVLLSGSAELEFENGETTELEPGDYLTIPAHKKHRVKSTSPEEKSVWLTVFYK